MSIIDRRLNPSGKSLPNRQRFLEKAKAQVKKAVQDAVSKRGVKEIDSTDGVEVDISGGTEEPSFQRGPGDKEHTLPGNKEFRRGDEIDRPKGGDKGGGGREGSVDSSGIDSFRFILTREEFLEFFFNEMELPFLERRELADMETTKPRRAGFSTSGSPTSINVVRSVRRGMMRHIALGRPSQEEIEALEAALALAETDNDPCAITKAQIALETARDRIVKVPFLDPIDIRYNRFDHVPTPRTAAVMFCLMDVSGSMGEFEKDIAKRFFMLLYLFLVRQYGKVEVVFIRFTQEAEEVDEQTFFYDDKNGGTVVSTSLVEMLKVQKARYPVDQWNIYAALCSDGDNAYSDGEKIVDLLTNQVSKVVNYFAYVEARRSSSHYYDPYGYSSSDVSETCLMASVKRAQQSTGAKWLQARQVESASDVYPVLAELFAKKRSN